MGKIGSLNLDIRIENASDSHHFGRIGSITGRKCSRHEFNPRSMHKFRRGMPKGVPAARNCRLAQEAAKGGAILDAITKSEGLDEEMAQWADRGEKCMGCGFKPGKMSKNWTKMRRDEQSAGDRVAAGIKRTGAEQELRTGNAIGRNKDQMSMKGELHYSHYSHYIRRQSYK